MGNIMLNYFSEKELMCKCGCGKFIFDDDFLNKINHIRHNVGRPLYINSGYRCEKHNKEVGGKETSSHLKGCAVDIVCKSDELRFKIIKQAINFGVTRIGIGKTFIHLDDDKSKNAERIWTY